MKPIIVLLAHQVLFQGLFFAKNILLKKRIGKQIRGRNKEAVSSIIFFTLFICTALVLSITEYPITKIQVLSEIAALVSAIFMLIVNLIISSLSLFHMKDSWRVGVLEDQETLLITSGIYQFTRNPYFLSYLIMFVAYTVLLQSGVLLALSLVGFFFVHKMILKEEEYLIGKHGDAYQAYKNKVPRYIII